MRHVASMSESQFYAVNWRVSRWNGRDTMDVIKFFISSPGLGATNAILG